MAMGTLIEFGGLPGTGKSTLARSLADHLGAVWLRIDEIESAMRRNGLTAAQTGITAYSVAHDVAASHLRRGLTVIADAVNAVTEARDGWRHLAATTHARHIVIETACPDTVEHRRRVESRVSDLPGWSYPDWEQVHRTTSDYQPRTDVRLVVDTTRPVEVCNREIERHLALAIQ
ncbi:AAA family ATPase [Actinopolymorpha singaporensis]